MFQIPDRLRSRPMKILAALALFAGGCAAGTAATRAFWPAHVMAPAKAVPVASLATVTQPLIGRRVVAVRGRVEAIYGNQFILADSTGNILVAGGRGNDVGALVKRGDQVAVQGYLDNGVVSPIFLSGMDGQVTAIHGNRKMRRGK